jgi:hypothetical protein
MTVDNVRTAVIAYGFNPDLDDNDQLFIEALNASIQEIQALCPTTGTIEIVNEPCKPIYSVKDVTEIVEGMSFTAMARSAVFEVDGSGQVTVTAKEATVTIDGANTSTAAWDAKSGWKRIEVCASAYSEITIAFSGVFHMRNMAFYEYPAPPTAHIKCGDYIDYKLAELAPDFGAISYILRDGFAYNGGSAYRILNNDILRLPAEDRGTFEVVYTKSIPYISQGDTKIPLRNDVLTILPVLVASYVWSDDAPERSLHYRNVFKERIRYVPTERYVTNIRDTKGWS